MRLLRFTAPLLLCLLLFLSGCVDAENGPDPGGITREEMESEIAAAREDAYNDGYSTGYDEGYDDGYDCGHYEGYYDGYNDYEADHE